ncbi:hypothetical protein MBLNU230_g2330t1 [Neophaeotheca triangularis]
MLRSTPRTFGTSRRAFQTTARLGVGKESQIHDETRPQRAEQEKQAQLKEQAQGKGQWHEELASDSESGVKADRGELEDSGKGPEKLQQETAQKAQRERGSKK